MPLIDIIRSIESSKGFQSDSNEDEKSNLITRINKAAKEIYVKDDLDGSLVEQIFDLDISSPQIVLPPNAGWIRGCRYTDSGLKIVVNNYIPRYHHGGYDRELWTLRFRELPKRVLYRDITNQSILKLSIPEANDEVFKVIIIGSNSNSLSVKEEVDFSSTDIEKETINEFNEITGMFKSTRTKFDITIKDVDDTILALFPNYETELIHLVFQISESFESVSGINSIEVLYKLRYIPMAEDYDVFQCGSQYEDTIYWKFRELYTLDKEAEDDPASFSGKSAQLKAEIDGQNERGQVLKVNYAPNPVYSIFTNLRRGM